MEKRTAGVVYATLSYLIWGLTPLYWKIFSGVSSIELLVQRMFWAFFISIVMLAASGGLGRFRASLKDKKMLGWIVLRALLLLVNWYTYIWAIGNSRVLEASFGYYLNPLVSIFLGLIFMKERLNTAQWIAVSLAAAGVLLKTILLGSFPLVSVVLAFTFGFYGLMKKKSTDGSLAGMVSESFVLLPLSSFYLIFSGINGTAVFPTAGVFMKLLFVTTGIITVVPLVLFSKGATRIPLTWIGFLQFLAPTMMFLFGTMIYGETISLYDLSGFMIVWAGIIVFLISTIRK